MKLFKKPTLAIFIVLLTLSNANALVKGKTLLPEESSIRTHLDGGFLLIEIVTPNTAPPFWGGSPNHTVRQTYSVYSRLPIFSLVTAIGTDLEKKAIITPKNILQNHVNTPIPSKELPLFMNGKKVGIVKLFTDKGAINTHKAVYLIQKEAIKFLGDSFLILQGHPFARYVTPNAEQVEASDR